MRGSGNRETEKEEMWKRQQEILAERRSGSRKSINEAEKRRQRVRQEVDRPQPSRAHHLPQIQEKEDEKRQWREALARGEKPKRKPRVRPSIHDLIMFR